MGAWIEISYKFGMVSKTSVAPFVGAWIEIMPSSGSIIIVQVAPFVGAWIEMLICARYGIALVGRSLRGSVD